MNSRSFEPLDPLWSRLALVVVAVFAVFMLFGCSGSPSGQTTGQQVDAAIDKTRDAMGDARQSAGQAAEATGTALADSAITVRVKAQLAADPDLQTLDIGVTTQAGRTTLLGSARDEAARERATQMTAAVSGVTSVDNLLVLKP